MPFRFVCLAVLQLVKVIIAIRNRVRNENIFWALNYVINEPQRTQRTLRKERKDEMNHLGLLYIKIIFDD
jgi:hypothetical protein